MRLVLEISSGPSTGQKKWLQARQMLHVGRTERADLAIPSDQLMSEVHFVVQADRELCRLRDIDSHHGTFINARRVSSAVLRDGDQICAGATTFVVSIDGVTRSMTRGEMNDSVAAPAVMAESSLSLESSLTYEEQTCESGLSQIVGAPPFMPPPHVAGRLARVCSMYLIVDFNRLDRPIPENLVCPDYLINWVPEQARERYSPLLLGESEGVDLLALIEECWGKDGLIGIYSELDKPQLLARLRPAAGAFCCPSVLQPQLETAAPESANHLLSGIKAVLLERRSSADWSLIGANGFVQTLHECGFVPAGPKPIERC